MEPSISDLAEAAQSAYGLPAPTGYSRVNEFSSADISTFKHDKNPHYVVSHRGTDLGSNTVSKQLKADLGILVGNRNQDKLHRERVKETERIMKGIKTSDPNHDIYVVGHSLGGSTAHQALVKSAYVRENTKALNTFNAGASPLQHKGMAKSNKAYKIIADKSVHHHISGDDISGSIKSNLIGTHKTYKNTKKPSLGMQVLKLVEPLLKSSPLGGLVHFGADRLTNTLSSHSLDNFIKKKK